jgi:hypothetical protein
MNSPSRLSPAFFKAVAQCVITATLAGATASALGAQAPVHRSSFTTRATFSVDTQSLALSSAIAVIEPRLAAPGYSWVRIYFYSFPLSSEDVTDAMNGSVASMDKKWNAKASNPRDYNRSRAVIQLSVDKDFKVGQVDMSVPGHSCTIASSDRDVQAFAHIYKLDRRHLRLKTKGSYVCDLKSLGVPDKRFRWAIDVDIPVFETVRASPRPPASPR